MLIDYCLNNIGTVARSGAAAFISIFPEKWRSVWELERSNSKQQCEGLQSLLIKPIQRILKYPLFLQQMRDSCTKGCVERQQAEQALQRMQALAEYINEMQRLIEQYGKDIEEIATKASAESQLQFSQLLMYAHVEWLNCLDKSKLSCMAFVFTSTVLILCPSPKNKIKYHKILPVYEVEIKEFTTDNVTESKYYFALIHKIPQRKTPELDVKTQFIRAIQKAYTLSKKDQHRPLSGSSQSDGGYGSDRHHS
uniref:DH domain-containing protein n=1 Tax=Syphacia muris TaxID=451379 RepID=A0A0N5ASY2_9BILA